MRQIALGLVGAALLHATGALAADERAAVPLEKRSYIQNMKVLATHFANEDRGAKLQMMVIGERRFLVQPKTEANPGGGRKLTGQIIEVSNPLKPVLIKDGVWGPDGYQFQVAYQKSSGRWIAIVGYDQGASLTQSGLRGLEFYDLTDPTNPRQLSKWSVDGGDPNRPLQTGGLVHRSYYDGGKYAYITAAPDNSFFLPAALGMPSYLGYLSGLQILDVSDAARPRLVTNWHVPGQRIDELEQRQTWPSAGDPRALPILHGPVYVPHRVENGGTLGFGSWGALGVIVHDLSDINHPRVLTQWQPPQYVAGPSVVVHTVDVARLDRGFVIANPEAMWPQCQEPWAPTYILDITQPREPKLLSKLPIPQPPREAPYRSFCERYGRFNAHNPPHLKAPGKPRPNFTCYTYFSAGLQCYDITDPRAPAINAYFVPSQGPQGAHAQSNPDFRGEWIRTADNVFVEWDRNLIWLATDSGLYLLSTPPLGKPVLRPMKVREWALPGINEGHP